MIERSVRDERPHSLLDLAGIAQGQGLASLLLMPEPNALVIQRTDIASGLMILQVASNGWPLPAFRPGQFGVLGLPATAARCALADSEPEPGSGLIRRPYSISSASVQDRYLEFYITLVYSGALTPRLFALQVGDPVYLLPQVAGLFTIDQVPVDKHLLMIGTGTGLAPYMSMVRTCLARDRQRQVTVVHGARHSWDLGYRSELLTLADFCDHFCYLPVISRSQDEHIDWSGATGYVQEFWRSGAIARAQGFEPSPDNTHVLLCGHPQMIEAMLVELDAGGWRFGTRREPGNVHAEQYW